MALNKVNLKKYEMADMQIFIKVYVGNIGGYILSLCMMILILKRIIKYKVEKLFLP
jgi:nitrate reductase gamma subunit